MRCSKKLERMDYAQGTTRRSGLAPPPYGLGRATLGRVVITIHRWAGAQEMLKRL
jgi:hypothetical protein